MLLEVCCENLESVSIASRCGADRIELCSSLETGGLTPTHDLVKLAIEQSACPLMILIRPRAGNFLYTPLEKLQILHEIETYLKLNIEGVVIGALTERNQLDLDFIKEINSMCADVSVTFHRAFDFVEDPYQALNELISLGINRVLTSGQCRSAVDGKQLIRNLIEEAAGQISIMPGAGINSRNISELIDYVQPREIHLSAKKRIINTMDSDPFNTDYYTTDDQELGRIIKIINN